ncbi:CARDB domain-containing protein [Methanosarcina sp.]|uniref:CARDB domain-containing protein n=1 Tax=Methanosarcina sp. TaxID=2213 RepID=UPI003C75E4AC
MKTGFLNSLICVLLIGLIIPGTIPGMASAAEDNDTESEDNGNLTIIDLVIESLSFDPENPEPGQKVDIIASVKNNGTGTSEATNLAYSINESRIGDSEVPEMEAGQSEQISFSWKPETEEGTVEVTAKIDEADSVPEADESNNEKTKSLTFKNAGLPDLIIDTFKHPEKSEPGEYQNIEIGVNNQGTLASEETKLKLYIDGNLFRERDIPPLLAGENSELFSELWVPVSEGTIEIKAVVDEGNLVNESNEENNQETGNVTVAEVFLPDLIVKDILPEQGDLQVGKLSNFTVKIKNQGTTPSEEVVAKYYINGKAASENIRVPALLQEAGTDVSFSLTPDKGGPMEVKVLVDSGMAVYESNETNNELLKVMNVKVILPDLEIESISSNPETPQPGENITFTASIRNNGPGNASSNELKYSINGTNETYSGKIPVSSLSAGNTTSSTFSWTPGKEGQMGVKAIVDAEGIISETEETNNEFTRTVTVSKETVPSSSGGGGSSRSSSSSAGSGTTSKEPVSNIDAKELSTRHIINGYPVKFDFVENATCITYVEFYPKKTFKRTTTIVEELKNKSVFVPKLPPGRIYKHVNIWVGDDGAGLPSSFKDGFIEFKVKKAWIKENNINQSLITLNWYDKGWQPLYTEKVSEDSNYVYLKAETPGFSCFAITEYTADEKITQETTGEGNIKETLRTWNSERKESNLNGSAEESSLLKNPMGKAKILMAISLPLFMILVEYFILKKKI